MDQSNLISCIYISDILSEELNPYNADRPFELPMFATCRIIIKSQHTSYSRSISFNAKIIEEDGVQWLPLKENSSEDLITTIPDEVLCPRVLILLQKKISLDVIKEGGETSELGSVCEEEFMPEIKLCHSFAGNMDIPFDDTFDNNDQEITEVNGVRQGTFGSGIGDEINRELQESLQRTMKLLEIEKRSKENVLSDMENMKGRFLQELSEGKAREQGLLEEIKDAESRYSAAKHELFKIKHEMKSMQGENARLLHTVSSNEVFSSNRIEELVKKMQIYEESYSGSDKILSKLSELSGISFEGSPEVLREKDQTIAHLQREINELKIMNNSLQIARNNNNIDELEESVKKFVRESKITSPFIRDKEQTYLHGNKRISILLKDSQLLCRVGGIFKPLEEYMSTFASNEITISHKIVKSSPDVHKDIEEAKLKSSSSRKNNKSVTIGPKTTIKRGSTNY